MADDGRPTRVLEPSVRYRAYLTFATRDAWRLLTGPRADGHARLPGLPSTLRRYAALGMAERSGRRARAASLARAGQARAERGEDRAGPAYPHRVFDDLAAARAWLDLAGHPLAASA